MKKIIFLFLLIPLGLSAQKNDSLSLDLCYKLAYNNYPLSKQSDLFSEASKLRLKNLENGYLPQVFLNAQASYQSDVTNIPIHIPNITIPEIYKDQYKISLDLNQNIYDGGNINALKKLENISLAADKENIEVELYKLKDMINQIFFNVILLQENEKILKIANEDIKAKLTKIESGIINGIMIKSNADVFYVEVIKIQELLTENKYNRIASLKMLSDLLNIEVQENSFLKLPDLNSFSMDFKINRPEINNYSLQQSKINALKDMTKIKTKPKLSAFAQVGYGRPGFNMFYTEFDKFYYVAARLNWNIWDWNQTKREKQIYEIQSNIIDNQKETFNKNIKISSDKEISDIQKYEELIKQDSEIIKLREKIVNTASSQVDNGIITTTEYISEHNNTMQAKLNLEIHKIQLIKAKVNYLNLTGNL
jgi:outer membrane protein TolC